VNSARYVKRRGIYPLLFTSPSEDSCVISLGCPQYNVMTSSSKKLGRRCLTVFVAVSAIKKFLLTINFHGKSILQRTMKKFGPEAEHLPVPGSHIADDFTAVGPNRICLFFGSVFQFGFLKVKSLLFPEMCNFEFTLHPCKPTRNWFFSR